MSEEWICKSELARRLGISAAAITKYVRKGLPTRSLDGWINWPTAQRWVRLYVAPHRSGSYRFRMAQKAAREATE